MLSKFSKCDFFASVWTSPLWSTFLHLGWNHFSMKWAQFSQKILSTIINLIQYSIWSNETYIIMHVAFTCKLKIGIKLFLFISCDSCLHKMILLESLNIQTKNKIQHIWSPICRNIRTAYVASSNSHMLVLSENKKKKNQGQLSEKGKKCAQSQTFFYIWLLPNSSFSFDCKDNTTVGFIGDINSQFPTTIMDKIFGTKCTPYG